MSNSEVSGSSGVVRNSALSFVAPPPAQPLAIQSEDARVVLDDTAGEHLTQTDRLVPAGLKALCDACSRLYPEQPNPLQVTTRLKYWLGGHDPLDYISMYWNPGRPEEHIPPHWHYVSFGLSDLHGDGRVHPPPPTSAGAPPSGYGLELTLRLAAGPAAPPPLWPAALLQALARYIFTTGNKFYAGDHISWHAALDGGAPGAKSRIRHLLVADDPQLTALTTPHGTVNFLQVVGCTSRELRAAQLGSGFEVLKALGAAPCCGPWLVTRPRARSARGLRRPAPHPAHPAHPAHSPPPAQLAGVSARVRWEPWTPANVEEPGSPSELSPRVEQLIKDTLQRGLTTMTERSGPEGHMSTDSFEMSSMERALPAEPMQGSWRGDDSVEFLRGVHLVLNAEAASLLPLAIDGRVLAGRSFTWREGPRGATLQPAARGALLHETAYAARGAWLQISVPKKLAEDMSKQVAKLSNLATTDSETDSEDETTEKEAPPALPLTLTWPQYKLKISVVSDSEIL